MSTDLTSPPIHPDDAPPILAPEPNVNRPIWQLVAGAALVVAILWWLGGWAVPFVIFAIVAMVVVHELGHFLTARWTGMKATEFFVGFGPKLWSKKIGETEFGLKAIVIGGYVRILGMTTNEELEEVDEPRSFRQATFPRRVLVASAGSIMHLLMALVLAWIYVTSFGVPSTNNEISVLSSWSHPTPAQLAGMRPGDIVLSIDGHAVSGLDAFRSAITNEIGHTLSVVVQRAHRDVTLHVTPVNGRHETTTFWSRSQHRWIYQKVSTSSAGFIGVELASAPNTPVSLAASMPRSVELLGSWFSKVAVGTYHVFSPAGLGHIVNADVNSSVATSTNFTMNYRPSSIYGIGQYAVQVAYHDPSELLLIFMLINLGVGLINMLPMLPLDGGYVAVAIYERIRTRRGAPRYHADVNKLTPVVYAFLAVLLVVFLSALYLDITHPL